MIIAKCIKLDNYNELELNNTILLNLNILK